MSSQESRKQAAIATLGSLGGGMGQPRSFRHSSISPKDISAKPNPQKQLGQRENNRFLAQTELLKGPLSANVNKSASFDDVTPYISSSYVKKQSISVPAYTEQPYTMYSGDVSTTKQADLSGLTSMLQSYAPAASNKIVDASKNLYSTIAKGFKPPEGQDNIFSNLGKQVSNAATGVKDKFNTGIDKLRELVKSKPAAPSETQAPTPAPTPTPAMPSLPEMMGPPSSLATKQPALAPATVSRASMLAAPEAKPATPFVNPLTPAAAPNPLAKPDIAPTTVAADYALDTPNYTQRTFGGQTVKDYDPAAIKAFVGQHNKAFPNKPIDESTAPYFLESLESKFGGGNVAPANGSLQANLNAGNNAGLLNDPNKPLAEFAHGLNLIKMDTQPDASDKSPYAVAQQMNYDIKNQQLATNFSQLPQEQQANAVMNIPYARKVDTITMLRESNDPNSIAIADRIQALDDSIYKQHAAAMGPVAIPGFMGGKPVSLMTVLSNTADSRTFDQRVQMLPPEMREKVKTLPPGVLSQLRYRADVMTGNGEASAAVNSADAYRQTGVGKSDSAVRNFRENVGIGAVQPVGDAIDTVNAIAKGKPTNKVLGNPDNYAGVIAGGNLIADKSDRIKGYNQNISAAIASGDPDRIKMIPQFRAERDKLTGAVANVSKTLTGKDYELDGASNISQLVTEAGKGNRLAAVLAPLSGAFNLTPQWALANMLGRGSVYGAEGGPGLGQYITPDNRGVISDVVGATLAPGVGMAAKGVSSGATNTAKGLADALIPREIASVVPKAAPNAVKAAPKALTGAQQFAKDMAGKFNPPKPPLPGPSPDIAQLAAKGGYNMASGMLNPRGYGLSDLMYPAGAAYGRIRQGLKSNLDPSKGVAGLVNLLQSKNSDGTVPQASTAFDPNSAAATLMAGLTPLQKALIAGGISIPAAIALSRSIGSKGSDELPEDEEAQL
jgi:hypothetical protein